MDVCTALPSISGSRSLCTPSALASADERNEAEEEGEQILSISSRNTMPSSSMAFTASLLRSSLVISFDSAVSVSMGRASLIGSSLRVVREKRDGLVEPLRICTITADDDWPSDDEDDD